MMDCIKQLYIRWTGLNRKRYIRKPILMESTIYINLIKRCYPHPSRYWTLILNDVLTDWPGKTLWLIYWCLTPTLAIFQLYRVVNKFCYSTETSTSSLEIKHKTYLPINCWHCQQYLRSRAKTCLREKLELHGIPSGCFSLFKGALATILTKQIICFRNW